jgi:hypothetical protein
MVEVPIMDVINMVRMFNGRVAAVSAVLVTVVGMGAGGAHKMWWLVNTDKENSFAEIRPEQANVRPVSEMSTDLNCPFQHGCEFPSYLASFFPRYLAYYPRNEKG